MAGVEAEVGEQGQDGFDVSAGRAVYERCGDDRAAVGVEEGFAEGAGIGNADADVLHQSSGQGTEQVAHGGTGESEEAAFKARESCAGRQVEGRLRPQSSASSKRNAGACFTMRLYVPNHLPSDARCLDRLGPGADPV